MGPPDREQGGFTWQGKRILLVSPEPWGPVRLSKHHYATALVAAGAEVFFLGPDLPATEPPMLVQRQAPGEPALVWRRRPLRGLRFLPRPLRERSEARQMALLAQACGGPFDLLWNFDLHRFRALQARQHARLRIQHVMDLRDPAALHGPAALSDLVITVSPRMAETLFTVPGRLLHVPHAWMPRPRPPVELPPLPATPRLGYLGNLAMRGIRWSSLLAIAQAHPEAALYLMGPVEDPFGAERRLDPQVEAALRTLPNVHFTGAIAYDEVPAWLEAMDLLLIDYDPEALGNPATSTHKLLEYLASGKLVVSSFLEDHKDLDELLVMAAPDQAILPLVGVALRDLAHFNAPDMQARRKALASGRSYVSGLEQVARALEPGAHR